LSSIIFSPEKPKYRSIVLPHLFSKPPSYTHNRTGVTWCKTSARATQHRESEEVSSRKCQKVRVRVRARFATLRRKLP
jgi:hypothetical protein